MIECTDKNVYYNKRKKPRKIFRVFFLLLIVFGVFLYYKNVVEVFIIDVCADNLKSYSTQSVNSAVLTVITENPYADIIHIEKNENGDIVLITTDSIKVNELNKRIATKGK